jgi:hypothetical protein
MDNVDRIAPINPIGSSLHLKITETNKDGGHKQSSHDEEQPHPHDVLELHDSEIPLEAPDADESEEQSSIGLDLAV